MFYILVSYRLSLFLRCSVRVINLKKHGEMSFCFLYTFLCLEIYFSCSYSTQNGYEETHLVRKLTNMGSFLLFSRLWDRKYWFHFNRIGSKRKPNHDSVEENYILVRFQVIIISRLSHTSSGWFLLTYYPGVSIARSLAPRDSSFNSYRLLADIEDSEFSL